MAERCHAVAAELAGQHLRALSRASSQPRNIQLHVSRPPHAVRAGGAKPDRTFGSSASFFRVHESCALMLYMCLMRCASVCLSSFQCRMSDLCNALLLCTSHIVILVPRTSFQPSLHAVSLMLSFISYKSLQMDRRSQKKFVQCVVHAMQYVIYLMVYHKAYCMCSTL